MAEAEFRRKPEQMDAEDAQRLQQRIDTAQGPGPVLDQDEPAPMPIFADDERTQGEIHSAIDPAEFAALDRRRGEELDRIQPLDADDAPDPAGQA